MARDVIMPALGMAQETGLIVAWLKKPGESVKAGEPLFEVETDKAVMAVEADADGVLADLRHGEGAEVPVGEVIARIAELGETVVEAHDTAPALAAEVKTSVAAPSPATPPGPSGGPRPAAAVSVPSANGSILASPKARRLAKERGIDLRALILAGATEPLHAADLDRLPALTPGSGATLNRVAARAEVRAFAAFRKLLAEEGAPQSDAAIWAAFAAGSLRDAVAPDPGILFVAVERRGVSVAVFRDPDLGPLAGLRETGSDQAPSLILRDLTGSRLTEVALARDGGPSLSLWGGDETFGLTLAFPQGSLSEEAALAFLEGFAARIEQPLRHLL